MNLNQQSCNESVFAIRRTSVGRKQQAGLTLVEALAFLGLFGVVIAGAISMYSSGASASTVNGVAADLNGIKASVKSMALAGTPYTSINMKTLADTGRLSSELTISGTGATSKGTYGDGSAITLTGAASSFTLALTGLDGKVCENLLLAMGKSGYTNTPACTAGAISFTYA